MSFLAPNFNLTANVWRNAVFVLPPPAPTLVTPAVLFGKHLPFSIAGAPPGKVELLIYIGVPKLTDVRGTAGGNGADEIELPAGSGRYYAVQLVDDVGKGYLNEYRVAFCLQENRVGGYWPYPTP